MNDIVAPYGWSLLAIALTASLYVVQLIVFDLTMDGAKHVAGTPVTGGHDSALFRASRAAANSLENMPVFWALTLTAIGLSAAPSWTNLAALVFAACRIVHMGAYYADQRTLRGYSWMAGVVCLLALIALVAMAAASNLAWLASPLPGVEAAQGR